MASLDWEAAIPVLHAAEPPYTAGSAAFSSQRRASLPQPVGLGDTTTGLDACNITSCSSRPLDGPVPQRPPGSVAAPSVLVGTHIYACRRAWR